jgi:hypothetical protein
MGNPMKTKFSIILMLLISVFSLNMNAADKEPPVKKSRSSICHEKGSTYYSRTKHYTSFNSMKDCLDSGGRRPKR